MNKYDKKLIILNFSDCRYIGEIHSVLKKGFGFPDYYGENWSALWDCLHGRFYGMGEYQVRIYGFYSIKDELREFCSPMIQIFEEVHNDTPNVSFVFEKR